MTTTTKYLLMVFILCCLVLAGCANKDEDKQQNGNNDNHKLHIAAAASLTDVSKDLENAFKKDHPNSDITFNYGGSGALRQQIEKGAPVDVFMSANTKDVDALKEKNKAHDTYNYAQNKLVLIGEKDTKLTSVKDLKEGQKLAIGEAQSVPAGKYATEYLQDKHLYNTVKDKLVYAKDVRQVLNYVEKGNAQLGYVYKTDLYPNKSKNDNVEEIGQVELKKPIIYKAGITSDNQLAKDWMQFLKSDKAKKILKEYQFEN